MKLESDIVDSDEWIRWASLSVQAGACAISAPRDKKRARDGITAGLRPTDTARVMPGAICDLIAEFAVTYRVGDACLLLVRMPQFTRARESAYYDEYAPNGTFQTRGVITKVDSVSEHNATGFRVGGIAHEDDPDTRGTEETWAPRSGVWVRQYFEYESARKEEMEYPERSGPTRTKWANRSSRHVPDDDSGTDEFIFTIVPMEWSDFLFKKHRLSEWGNWRQRPARQRMKEYIRHPDPAVAILAAGNRNRILRLARQSLDPMCRHETTLLHDTQFGLQNYVHTNCCYVHVDDLE